MHLLLLTLIAYGSLDNLYVLSLPKTALIDYSTKRSAVAKTLISLTGAKGDQNFSALLL